MNDWPRYAVNLAAMLELMRNPANWAVAMFLKAITTETVVNPMPGKEISIAALAIGDDVGTERWQAIVKVIRSRLSYQQLPMYECRNGRWTAVR